MFEGVNHMPGYRKLGKTSDQRRAMLRQGDLAAYRQVLSYMTKEDTAKKLFDEIGPKYADRTGGYTRVVRIGFRRGDAAEIAYLELV